MTFNTDTTTIRISENKLIVLDTASVDLKFLFEKIFDDADAVDCLRRFILENNLECVLK